MASERNRRIRKQALTRTYSKAEKSTRRKRQGAKTLKAVRPSPQGNAQGNDKIRDQDTFKVFVFTRRKGSEQVTKLAKCHVHQCEKLSPRSAL